MIDISERILQSSSKPPYNAKPVTRWHAWRRVLQVLCGVLLVALPLTNGLRLDVRRDEFYFAWHRMAAHDLFLLFWVAMLGVWTLVAVSFLYGRLWCGWVCPQTLASDFADSLRGRLDKTARRLLSRRVGSRWAVLAARTVWVAALLAASLLTGYVFACYWLAPSTVAHAMLHPLADYPAALTAYGMTVVLAADMFWVRRKFCAVACPYGPLMSLLADKNTLAVRYLDERADDCIHCSRCEIVCPMGIDIKQGVGQLDCIGCGECVDACSDVLGKRGKSGLIEFRYGIEPERQSDSLTFRQRWGLWDRKRGIIVLTLLAFLSIVLWNMYGRLPLTASVIANGAITRDAHEVRNTYLLTLANGTPDARRYQVTVENLPGARVVPTPFITVAARGRRSIPLTVAVPAAAMTTDSRTPIQLRVQDGHEHAIIKTIFFTPAP